MIHNHVGNEVGALILFSFVFVALAIAFYLMYGKKDDKPTAEKH